MFQKCIWGAESVWFCIEKTRTFESNLADPVQPPCRQLVYANHFQTNWIYRLIYDDDGKHETEIIYLVGNTISWTQEYGRNLKGGYLGDGESWEDRTFDTRD